MKHVTYLVLALALLAGPAYAQTNPPVTASNGLLTAEVDNSPVSVSVGPVPVSFYLVGFSIVPIVSMSYGISEMVAAGPRGTRQHPACTTSEWNVRVYDPVSRKTGYRATLSCSWTVTAPCYGYCNGNYYSPSDPVIGFRLDFSVQDNSLTWVILHLPIGF